MRFNKVELLQRLSAETGDGSQFGLLSYKTRNIGDEIQSLAALQFLPSVGRMIERDSLSSIESSRPIKLILNAWFMGHPSWPPAKCIHPLFTSFHIGTHCYEEYGWKDPREWMLGEESLEYLKCFEPIGCRDRNTCDLLQQRGVECYFSGCLTLAFEAPMCSEERREILFVDPEINRTSLFSSIPVKRHKDVSIITHITDLGYAPEMRLHFAAELLRRYSQAHLVITSRLHCLLPCLAFGTPVLFIPPHDDAGRLSGYEKFYHSLKVADGEPKSPIPWEKPEPNPEYHVQLVRPLIARVSEFVTG